MLSNIVLFSILIFSLCLHISLQNTYLSLIKEEFQIKHIIIIKNESFEDTKMMKQAFEYSQFIKIFRDSKQIPKTNDESPHILVYIYPKYNFEKELKYLLIKKQILVMLILNDEQFPQIYNHLKLEISNQVFILKESSNQMYETYIINNQHIKRKLGHINLNTTKFIWNRNVDSNFYKRRANFHGLVLKAMTEFEGLSMNAHSTYINNAPFFSNNQTFLVNGYTYGLFNDLLHTLENKLNFTTMIYKRKEISWGHISPQSNGSYIGTGIVGDVFFGRADIVVTSLGITLKRGLYIDFLPAATQYGAAIYTPALDAVEIVDLKLFTSPFTITVWMIICSISILTAILKFFVFCYYDSFEVLEFLPAIWTSFISYFGGKPTNKSFDNQTTYKIVLFTSLFCGSLVWIFYRSYLSSQLSITKKRLPFTDLKSLSKTNWRYIVILVIEIHICNFVTRFS